jgi:hypothetical protein
MRCAKIDNSDRNILETPECDGLGRLLLVSPANEPVFHGSNPCSTAGVVCLAVVVITASSITCLRCASAGDHGQRMTIVICDTAGGLRAIEGSSWVRLDGIVTLILGLMI